jgi:hypothetical protein
MQQQLKIKKYTQCKLYIVETHLKLPMPICDWTMATAWEKCIPITEAKISNSISRSTNVIIKSYFSTWSTYPRGTPRTEGCMKLIMLILVSTYYIQTTDDSHFIYNQLSCQTLSLPNEIPSTEVPAVVRGID